LEKQRFSGRRDGELTSAVVLTIQSKLSAENQASVEASLFLKVKLFKMWKPLPYAEDSLAILEPTECQGCAEVFKSQFFGLLGGFTKVVGKACFTASAPFLLRFQTGDSLKPAFMVPYLTNDRHSIGSGYSKQGFIAKVCLLLGEDVAI
jgi:hypothetical protein